MFDLSFLLEGREDAVFPAFGFLLNMGKTPDSSAVTGAKSPFLCLYSRFQQKTGILQFLNSKQKTTNLNTYYDKSRNAFYRAVSVIIG